MNLKLDTLSLRSEIVTEMLKIDPALARQLFAQMGSPAIPQLTCSDSLIADPYPYFEVTAQIYKRGFTPSDRSAGANMDFLDNVLFAVSSGSELHASISLLSTLKLTSAGRQRADISLAHAINQLGIDPRTFSATVYQFTEDLTTTAVPGDIGESALLTAAREYIVRQSTAGACIDEIHHPTQGADNFSSPNQLSANPGALAALNRLLATYGISPIRTKDLVPQTVINQKEDVSSLFWQDSTSKSMENLFKALRDAADRGDGDSGDWENRATQFLNQMRHWPEPPNQDDAEKVLLEKALLYSGFMDAIPPDSPLLEPALVDYIGFLSQPPPKATDEVFILSSIDHLFMGHRTTAESPELMQAIAKALQTVPNPSVSIWAALVKLDKTSMASNRAF